MVDKYEEIKDCIVNDQKYWVKGECQSMKDLKSTYTSVFNRDTCSIKDGVEYINGKCELKESNHIDVINCYKNPKKLYYNGNCIPKTELKEIKLGVVCERNQYTRKNAKEDKCLAENDLILDKICYEDGLKQINNGCYEDLRGLSQKVCKKDMYYNHKKKRCMEKSFHPPGIDQIVFVGAFVGLSKIYSMTKKK